MLYVLTVNLVKILFWQCAQKALPRTVVVLCMPIAGRAIGKRELMFEATSHH